MKENRTIDHILYRIHKQQEYRPHWIETETPHDVATMVLQESRELVQAIEQFDVLKDAEYEVVSEVGDILCLVLKFCDQMGIDPEKAIDLKLRRNDYKYSPTILSDGRTKEAAIKESKTMYQLMGGDHAFFMADSLQEE